MGNGYGRYQGVRKYVGEMELKKQLCRECWRTGESLQGASQIGI